MNIRPIFYCFGLSLLLMTSVSKSVPPAGIAKWGSVTFANNVRIDVEIVDTPKLRANGLMYRSRLGNQQGMLFVYPEQTQQGVWMKNTLLALDVIFVSGNGKIVSILKNLLPCQHDPCPIYTSTSEALYMLEVQTGFIAEHDIKIGQEVMIEYRHDKSQP